MKLNTEIKLDKTKKEYPEKTKEEIQKIVDDFNNNRYKNVDTIIEEVEQETDQGEN